MNSSGKLKALIVCLGQLLILKIYNNFNLRNKINKKIAVLLISIFLHTTLYFYQCLEFAALYFSIYMVQNLLSALLL